MQGPVKTGFGAVVPGKAAPVKPMTGPSKAAVVPVQQIQQQPPK